MLNQTVYWLHVPWSTMWLQWSCVTHTILCYRTCERCKYSQHGLMQQCAQSPKWWRRSTLHLGPVESAVAFRQRSALEWWSAWGSRPAQKMMRRSGWWLPAVAHPLFSVARHVLPTDPCNAGEQVPGEGWGGIWHVWLICFKHPSQQRRAAAHLRPHTRVPADVVSDPELQVT